nr:hypothetical protein [Nitrosomonas nitrosa]
MPDQMDLGVSDTGDAMPSDEEFDARDRDCGSYWVCSFGRSRPGAVQVQ